MEKNVYAELVPSFAENREAALAARSVIRWPETLHEKTPILILHGTADWRVDPSQALQLVTKLYEIKHPVRFVFFEGGIGSQIWVARQTPARRESRRKRTV